MAIGKLGWSIDGSVTYTGPLAAGTPVADYTNLANWQGRNAITPNQASPIAGADWNGIPEWEGHAQAVLNPPEQ